MNKPEILFTLYTTSWCGSCFYLKHLLKQQNLESGRDYIEINIDDNQEALETVKIVNDGNESVPTLIFKDDSILTEPSNQELLEHLNRFLNSNV